MCAWFGMICACYLQIQFSAPSLMLLSMKENITISQKYSINMIPTYFWAIH